MHPSRLFHQDDPSVLAALVAQRGFALLVGVADGRPIVAQAPVLLEDRRLRFHLSRGNALSAGLQAPGVRALAVVAGPDAYVSPDWYGLDDQVPTWNYLSVEMEGPVTVVDDAAAATLLDDLSAHFEAPLAPKPVWTRHKMTPGRFDALLGMIVAFEMTVERFEGVWKLGQNKSPEAIAGVVAALEGQPDQGSRDIADLMSRL
ncbi:MAG: FMN-binding negative transcriptional regulator [Caulobacterales bacterium]|nr:FMN-binding negative transcriptional regulator [Caulobacterales bacterium]